jgi:hypothetical protein
MGVPKDCPDSPFSLVIAKPIEPSYIFACLETRMAPQKIPDSVADKEGIDGGGGQTIETTGPEPVSTAWNGKGMQRQDDRACWLEDPQVHQVSTHAGPMRPRKAVQGEDQVPTATRRNGNSQLRLVASRGIGALRRGEVYP